jgi:CMP/dCMP kinase
MSVITISREVGSGGNELARMLCKTLSFRYFERNMMNEIAEEIGVANAEFLGIGENFTDSNIFTRYLDPSLSIARMGAWIDDEYGYWARAQEKMGENESVRIQADVIKAAAKKGNIVIVGRGGQVILKDYPNTYHIRITAPLAWRIDYAVLNGGLSHSEAKQKIHARDKAASEYVKKHYGSDPSDPALYHIVINMAKTGMAKAEKIIMAIIS